MLAHHYLSALDLSQAAGQPIADIGEKARDVLREAGNRASSLNSFDAAVRFYEKALALGAFDDADRADVQFRRARALNLSGDEGAGAALEEARDALLETGDSERAAEADALLTDFWRYRGNRDRAREHLDRAHALVQDLPPSAGKAHVLSQVSRYDALAGKGHDAIRIGQEALAMAEELGLDEIRAHALINIAHRETGLGRSDEPRGPRAQHRDRAGGPVFRGGARLQQPRCVRLAARRLSPRMHALRRGCGDRRAPRERARSHDSQRAMQLFHLFEKGEWDEGLQPRGWLRGGM